jgi:uncharacterized membrane protein
MKPEPTSQPTVDKRSSPSLRPLLVFLVVYALVFFALAARKFGIMNSNEGDDAVLVNAFWNTVHGRFFYSIYVGMSHFGVHVTPAILVGVPFYWLVPSAYTLLLQQSIIIASAGVPFFLLARKVLGTDRAAWLMTIAFLFYPTVVTDHVNQIHWEYWALPYVVGAVYFLEEKRFWPFMLFALLTMTGQESMPLTAGMFGVYAAVRHRGWKWIVSPIVLALAYGAFIFKVVIPHFAGAHGYIVAHYFGDLGKTPGELIMTCLTQPWRVIAQMWDLDRALYLIQMLQPLLWVAPLLCWETLFALPSLGISLLVNESAFRVIAWHYNPTSGALLCVAAVYGVRRLASLAEDKWHWLPGQLGLAFSICVLSLASWTMWFNIGDYLSHGYVDTLQKALELVPPDKSVLSPVTMLGHFAGRPVALHQLQFDPTHPMSDLWPREKMYDLDYIILDGNERRFPKDVVTRDLVMSFYTNTNYELILNENNVFVFRRRESVPLTP